MKNEVKAQKLSNDVEDNSLPSSVATNWREEMCIDRIGLWCADTCLNVVVAFDLVYCNQLSVVWQSANGHRFAYIAILSLRIKGTENANCVHQKIEWWTKMLCYVYGLMLHVLDQKKKKTQHHDVLFIPDDQITYHFHKSRGKNAILIASPVKSNDDTHDFKILTYATYFPNKILFALNQDLYG